MGQHLERISHYCAESGAKHDDPDTNDFDWRTQGTQIRSVDKRRRGNRTVVDIARGGQSRLSCLGLGLVSERALSRLLGG